MEGTAVYEREIANLQHVRSVLEAVKQSTEKIYQDIYQAKVNNTVSLDESKQLKAMIEKVDE